VGKGRLAGATVRPEILRKRGGEEGDVIFRTSGSNSPRKRGGGTVGKWGGSHAASLSQGRFIL